MLQLLALIVCVKWLLALNFRGYIHVRLNHKYDKYVAKKTQQVEECSTFVHLNEISIWILVFLRGGYVIYPIVTFWFDRNPNFHPRIHFLNCLVTGACIPLSFSVELMCLRFFLSLFGGKDVLPWGQNLFQRTMGLGEQPHHDSL